MFGLSKKLESRFKKSGHQIIDKINNEQVLTNEELSFLLGKLEYSFRKSNDELVDRISKEEKIKVDADAKKLLIEVSEGDLRRLVNTMQSAASVENKITVKLINEILDFVNPKEVEEMVQFAVDGDFSKQEML